MIYIYVYVLISLLSPPSLLLFFLSSLLPFPLSFQVSLLVERMRPVMLVGTAGCGKTQLINGLCATLDPAVRMSQVINMNFYTTSPVLQSTMESVLVKRTGTSFGPPGKVNVYTEEVHVYTE